MAPSGQQLSQPGRQPQSASPPLTPGASLERQTLGLCLVLALLTVVMGQLSNCLVMQHGLSSFLVSGV